MATATTMKTAFKVLHNKSQQTLYQALVHTKPEGIDEVRKMTEDNLRKMTKIRRESWSVRALRWYNTLP